MPDSPHFLKVWVSWGMNILLRMPLHIPFVHQEMWRYLERKGQENYGVIPRVTELTSWMVVVPKRDGSVINCIDFKMLNESVPSQR